MKVILFLDKKNGMLFGGKRQTSDRCLIRYIVRSLNGARLYINHFSKKLFENIYVRYIIDTDFLSIAEEGDVCVVENENILPYLEKITEIVVYRWDNNYPFTTAFCIDKLEGWEKKNTNELHLGGTHPLIFEEVWKRKER